MLNIFPNTKVFVYAPAGVVTGGIELLHQLVDVINTNGGDAYIIYKGDSPHIVPIAYKGYSIQLATEIEDQETNIVVLFEAYSKYIPTIKSAQIVFWWLSVDNFFSCNRLKLSTILSLQSSSYQKLPCAIAARQCLAAILGVGKNDGGRWSLNKLRKSRVAVHAYQSEYAKDFLEKRGFQHLAPLKDYINEDNFIGDFPEKREDYILYNPKKGIQFTQKLIQAAPNLKWTPIENMTRQEVIQKMRQSKVYIDFGYHPGKDRLPREAAMNGCTIVTGKLGSARFIDVDIPPQYKHAQRSKDIPLILDQIHDLIQHYEERIEDFAAYRQKICLEQEEFIADTLRLFHLDKP